MMFPGLTSVVGSYSNFVSTIASVALFIHLSEEEVTRRFEVIDLERQNSSQEKKKSFL